MARGIARFADVKRHIEKQDFDVALVLLRDFNPRPPVTQRQVRGINVTHQTAERDPLFQQIPQRRKHAVMNRLVPLVVGQQQAHTVARKRLNAEPREVSRFTRSRQPDGNHNALFQTMETYFRRSDLPSGSGLKTR